MAGDGGGEGVAAPGGGGGGGGPAGAAGEAVGGVAQPFGGDGDAVAQFRRLVRCRRCARRGGGCWRGWRRAGCAAGGVGLVAGAASHGGSGDQATGWRRAGPGRWRRGTPEYMVTGRDSACGPGRQPAGGPASSASQGGGHGRGGDDGRPGASVPLPRPGGEVGLQQVPARRPGSRRRPPGARRPGAASPPRPRAAPAARAQAVPGGARSWHRARSALPGLSGCPAA